MQPLEEWWHSVLNNADTLIHDRVLNIDEINCGKRKDTYISTSRDAVRRPSTTV